MINALKKNNSKFILIGKINGLSHEAKRARKRLRNLKVDEYNYHFINRKMLLGVNVRHHLLAYAFLRGIDYRKVESTCREDNKPSMKSIFEIIQLHAPRYIPYDPYTKTTGKYYSVTEEDVVAWLNGDK